MVRSGVRGPMWTPTSQAWVEAVRCVWVWRGRSCLSFWCSERGRTSFACSVRLKRVLCSSCRTRSRSSDNGRPCFLTSCCLRRCGGRRQAWCHMLTWTHAPPGVDVMILIWSVCCSCALSARLSVKDTHV